MKRGIPGIPSRIAKAAGMSIANRLRWTLFLSVVYGPTASESSRMLTKYMDLAFKSIDLESLKVGKICL